MELATGNRQKGHLSCQPSTVRGDAFPPPNMAKLHFIMHRPTHVKQSRFKALCIFRKIHYRNDLENLFVSSIEKKGLRSPVPLSNS